MTADRERKGIGEILCVCEDVPAIADDHFGLRRVKQTHRADSKTVRVVATNDEALDVTPPAPPGLGRSTCKKYRQFIFVKMKIAEEKKDRQPTEFGKRTAVTVIAPF